VFVKQSKSNDMDVRGNLKHLKSLMVLRYDAITFIELDYIDNMLIARWYIFLRCSNKLPITLSIIPPEQGLSLQDQRMIMK